MIFEYDHYKSSRNFEKHGIDFIDAQQIWKDARLKITLARTQGEERWIAIGRIELKHWSAIITRRNGITRITSVRRSRRKEIEIYENRRL